MPSFPLVCTACSCLCDDLVADTDGERITSIENACVRGAAFIYASQKPERRATCTVRGQPVFAQAAIAEAARLLKRSRHPLIFGLDNSTSEAQVAGIGLAERLGVTVDDTSSFCHGTTVEAILRGKLATCTLEEAQKADTIIYWGANPYHSHPRHLSKFSYYVRDRFREAGWVPDVTLAAVEVRDTETTSLCRPLFRLKPGEDGRFIREALAFARNGEGGSAVRSLVELVRRSRFCVIFVGLGLVYSVDNELSSFFELVSEFGNSARCAVVPMVGHYNSGGFNRAMFDRTGFVNRVSFGDGVKSGPESSFLEQVRNRKPDLLFVIGSDPFSSQPASLMRNLEGVPIICLDPFITETSRRAAVVLGGVVSGIECGGSARRVDGTMVALKPVKAGTALNDEDFLIQILEGVG